MESRPIRWMLRGASSLVLLFLYVPLALIIVYAFGKGRGGSWPPELFTTDWFEVAWENSDLKPAIGNSIRAGFAATCIALVLGTLASIAVHRFSFFGREAISFFLVLPIALPGIVTALALSSAVDFGHTAFGLNFGLFTIIIGHATFCVVVVFNNVIARLRRTPGNLIEASMDLGGDGWQTFRYVTFPTMRSALVAGALLAFGLSFDEIVVTIYLSGTTSTLPLWIFNNLQRAVNRPIVNVVAMVVLFVSVIPVYIAQRLAGGATGVSRRNETAA